MERRKMQNNFCANRRVTLREHIRATQKAKRNWNMWRWPSAALETTKLLLLLLLVMATAETGESHNYGLPSISQISPKSNSHLDAQFVSHLGTSSRMSLESTIVESMPYDNIRESQVSLSREEDETRQRARVERSAQPILNDNFPKSGPNDVHFPSDSEKEAVAGRYFQYNIKPTGTYDSLSENPERTQRARAGKTLNSYVDVSVGTSVDATSHSTSTSSASSSFLLKGDLRPLPSGSPINPTSSTATSTLATATAMPNNARQNPNPDIQDIITGIVKLLNGNVNVHANTQGIRRPTASRINNRGPPRISEVQTMPLDYDPLKPASLGSSNRPPPYPFDRPDRPFITGVPIPEQIVPYRPGFVSNRPPWHRNKPRPPISTTVGGRRPIPQYKPLPSSQMNPPPHEEQEQQLPHQPATPSVSAPHEHSENADDTASASDYSEGLDTPKPGDNTYDSEFSNEDINAQYIEVSDQNSELAPADNVFEDLKEDLQPPAPPGIAMTEQQTGNNKKKPTKHKSSDKKKHHSSAEYTTIIETSSVVNTVMDISSTYAPMPMQSAEDVVIDPSTEEVIFMTPSKTPALETAYVQTEMPPVTSAIPQSISTSLTVSPLNNAKIAASEGSIRGVEVPPSIVPTPSTSATPTPSTTTTTAATSATTTATTSETVSFNATPPQPQPDSPPAQYLPRPGIVLDDPEFKPGVRPRPPQRPQQARPPIAPPQPPTHIQPTRQHLPPGYGEIFDVTLSAIQGPGPGTGAGSQQTINIRPYGSYGSGGAAGVQQPQGEIIVSAAGEDGFVSIDGKRTYINLFGDPTDAPASAHLPPSPATAIPQLPSGENSGSDAVGGSLGTTTHAATSNPSVGASYGIPETEIVELQPTKAQSPKPLPQAPTTSPGSTRPHYRQRPTQPPVRIDTCIVGDDSTCDQAQHERCKTENGVSSCHCRPGFSRRKHREPCRKVISFFVGMRVDRIYEHRIVWDKKLLDSTSEPYGQLSYESIRAIDSAMSMTPYSDEFMEAKVNNIYRGDPNLGGSGVFVNLTIKLDESVESLRPNLRSDVQKHLLGVLHRRNNNIGNSVLYVSSPEGAVSALQDLDECESAELNDCHASASCANIWGSFRCSCGAGLRDPWADQPQRAGRDCQSCADAYCNNHGTCNYNEEGNQLCSCDTSHYGSQCEIDGEVLGVAIGASVAAVIIIVLTLVCLIMWSRRWQREQKNAMGSPVFGYMNTAPLKSAVGLTQPGYQVTLEDRMRWAQIADVMAQTNHYGAEPIAPTRPSSAMFAYPSLQAMGMGMGTMGGMSMQNTMQMHQNAGLAPPVPLPRRLGLSARSNGMRTLENSSSSEEEDRTDLLGRNFQVPRPKSRSNGSIANQSGIYYDVDYEPSGNGIGNTSVDHLYGSQNQASSHCHGASSNHIPGPQGIPMSTYTSGRAPSSYYMK